jgi:hypothetical protein
MHLASRCSTATRLMLQIFEFCNAASRILAHISGPLRSADASGAIPSSWALGIALSAEDPQAPPDVLFDLASRHAMARVLIAAALVLPSRV